MKIVDFDSKKTILRSVIKYLDFISPTYGPGGKSILIADDYNVKAIDDGKLASQDFELENEFENAVVKYIKEATLKTDDRVGDGTTTSAIIMADIVKQLLTEDDFAKSKSIHSEVKSLKKAVDEATKQIKKASKSVKTEEQLYEVAYNSFNNEEIATLISQTLFKLGKDGSISIQDSHGMNTECEIVGGLEIEKGFVSPYFINKDSEVFLENPYIILINGRVDSIKDIVPVIKLILESGKKEFVIIAEGFSEEVVGNIIINRAKNVFSPLLVETPGFGEMKVEYLHDIASVTGGRVIDPKKGDKLTEIKLEDLGNANKVISKNNSSVIIGGTGSTKKRVEDLKQKLSTTTDKYLKDKIEKRIASLKGGVAVIRVGARTENEQRTVKAKVEDAVNSAKVAFREGIVLGAGKTYESIQTSSETLNNALKAPRKQLEQNGKECLDENVYDPTEVLVASLESAVSIACGLVGMGGIVATKRKKEDSNEIRY